jgi:hypothetical protein
MVGPKNAIGVPGLRVHDLRHAAASVWLGAGADLEGGSASPGARIGGGHDGPVWTPNRPELWDAATREAGYAADAVVRAAIEKRAEGLAADFYDHLGYKIDYVGTFRSYDLHLVHRQTGEKRALHR